MARNHKFFFDRDGVPRARGPTAERTLMQFLENDVQGSDHVCHDLMEDLVAIEDGTDDRREFIGNAHSLVLTPDGAALQLLADGAPGDDAPTTAAAPPVTDGDAAGGCNRPEAEVYRTALKHFREVLEDWEAFILDDQLDDPSLDDDLHA